MLRKTKAIFNSLNIGIPCVTNQWLSFLVPHDDSCLMVCIKACM